MRVLVIGAGLGGLTLAQGLRREGIDVVVYEREGAQGRSQGVSLHIDDRGASALRECLPPAHAAMVEATMGGPREQTMAAAEKDGVLTIVGAQPSDGTAGRARPGRQVHRPLLRAVLLTGLTDRVRFDAAFTRFEQRADGTVRVWFADGTTDTADVVVGADGIGSTVRRQYLPDVRVVDTGRRMLMGATPLRAVADDLTALLGHDPVAVRAGDTTMVLGALRFTEQPATARQRWLPALPLSAVTDVENYVMWALPVARERVGSATADLPAPLRAVVAAAWPEVTVALRIGVIPPIPAWPASPVTVLGDAVHLAPGFGGNLAMQDALRLRDALVEARHGRLDLLDAIAAHEEAMRHQTLALASA